MSYILDALKKSEQERGSGGIPNVQTIHSSSLNYSNKKTYWPYILIVAVILNLVAILYFVLDKNKPLENNIAKTQANTIENNTVALTATNNTQNTTSAEQNKQFVDTRPITNNKSAEEINSLSTAAQTSTGKQIASLPVTDKNTKNNSSQTTTVADRNTAEDNANVIEFYELPESIKRQLPSIVISAHVYSTNPLYRSVVVNNNFKEEGEFVLDDLLLYEITSDGVILYFNGIKFHHAVVSGWQ